MKLPKLHLLCGSSDYRPAMHNIKIEGNKAYCFDAFIGMEFDLKNHFDQPVLDFIEGKLISKGVWSILCECEQFHINSGQLSCLTNKGWVSFPYLTQYQSDDFPSVKRVIDDGFDYGYEGIEYVGLNLNRLSTIKTVLRYTSEMECKFILKAESKAICIQSKKHSDFQYRCILMPVILSDANDY